MPNFSINLDSLETTVNKRSFKLSDVQGKIEKIAFDVVKFVGDDPDKLWQIQQGDNGESYIVALYQEDETKVIVASTKSAWSVLVKNSDVHIFYNKDFIYKMSSTQLGVPASELSLVASYLPAKLADSPSLVASMFGQINPTSIKAIAAKYNEFSKFANESTITDLIKLAGKNLEYACDGWLNCLKLNNAQPVGGSFKYEEPSKIAKTLDNITEWDQSTIASWIEFLKQWLSPMTQFILSDADQLGWFNKQTRIWSNQQARISAVSSARYIEQAQNKLATILQKMKTGF